MCEKKETDRELDRFDELTGYKRHFCPDWDFMAIDENCPEFEACGCFNKTDDKAE